VPTSKRGRGGVGRGGGREGGRKEGGICVIDFRGMDATESRK